MNFEDLEANEIYLIQALEVKKVLNLQEIEAFIPKKEIIKTINSLIDQRLIIIDEKITEKYKIKEASYLKINDEVLQGENLANTLSLLDRAKKQKELFLLILYEQKKVENQPVKKSDIFESSGYVS